MRFDLEALDQPPPAGEGGPLRIPLDSDTGRRSAALTYSGRAIRALGAVARGVPATMREFDAAPPLPADVPLVVLSAETQENLVRVPGLEHALDGLREVRVESHQRLAKRSTRGSWRIVPKSDHLIAVSQPDAVVEAIFSILDLNH